MDHWKTDDIVAALSGLPHAKKVIVMDQGGDHDTENIKIDPINDGEDSIYILGFDPENLITSPNDCMIEMVEVTDGCDSTGGLNTFNDANLCSLYGEVGNVLETMGFIVVKKMDDYF